MHDTFAGFDIEIFSGTVCVAGPPNSRVLARGAKVQVDSRCLTAGDEYEIEGMISTGDGRDITSAAVLDTVRAAQQLTPPIDPRPLTERRLGVKVLEPINVPVLLAAGPEAAHRLGLPVGTVESPLLEDSRPLRRAVKALRAEGWAGAIALPGYEADLQTIVIPRSFANPRENGHSAWVRILKLDLTVNMREVVAYAAGRRGRENGTALY